MSQRDWNLLNLEKSRFSKKQLKIIKKYFKDHQHEPYLTSYFSSYEIKQVFINKKTLRPEKSWASKFLSKFLLENKNMFQDKKILDMGSGSGIQALICALKGAQKVHAVDIYNAAINSSKINSILYNLNNILIAVT